MANGLKIDSARLISTGRKVSILDFDSNERNNIKCEFCDAKLKYTESFLRHNGNDESIRVRSFFSLSPKTEHGVNCKNTLESAIEYFAKDSDNIENVDERMLFAENNTIELRIHILAESIKLEKQCEEISSGIGSDNIGTTPKTTNNHLSSYLKTAHGLAKIWNYIQDSSDRAKFKERVVLKFNRRKILWKNFVFETMDLDSLITKEYYSYPVALILEAKSEEYTKPDGKNKHCVKCISFIDTGSIIVPRIYYNSEKIMFLPRCQYLIIAHVKHSKGSENFHNLNIYINHPSQVALLS